MTTLAEKFGFCKLGAARQGKKPAPLPRNLGRLHERVPRDRTYSGKVFPSGDFSIGIVPAPKVRCEDQQYECTKKNLQRQVVSWDEGGQSYHEVAYLRSEKLSCTPNFIYAVKSSHRKKYGQRGITSYGKKMVRSGAVLLEKEWGRARTGFATLTVPPLSESAMYKLCTFWGDIVRRFFEEFRRHQLRVGGDVRYVCVTEIQESRFRTRGEVGLHLHFLYKARHKARGSNWLISANWCRDTWRRILANRLADVCADIPLPRCELKLVRKSASGYLGKYMSKGTKINADITKAMPTLELPSQWWSLSSEVRSSIQERILRLNSISAYTLWTWAENSSAYPQIYFTKSIEVSSDAYGIRRVGILGRLDFDWFKIYYESLDIGLPT